MNDALLAALRLKRDDARHHARAAQMAAEEARAEYHRLDEALSAAETVVQELDEFNRAASDLLG